MDRYELFKDALNHCGMYLPDLPDEEIGYHLFEEFDGDCISFLNEDLLDQLLKSGKITQEIVYMSLELSRKLRALKNTNVWNIQSVRNSEKWLEILKLLDLIKAKLHSEH